MMDKISERLKSARKRAGLTQRELGEAVGISAQAIAQWEQGQTAPSNSNALKVAQATGVSAQWLLFGPLQEQHKNATIPPLCLVGVVSVPIVSLHEASRKAQQNFAAKPRVSAYFPCSNSAVAIEITDDSNAPAYPRGSLWIIDPEKVPTPGMKVLATFGDDGRPVLGEFREEASVGGIVQIVAPLNGRWATARSDVARLVIVGAMTEAITAG